MFKVKHLLIISCFITSLGFSQVLEFDMLEMKYNQGYYRMVYRKANRLLDNPQYDYSYLPRYYRALTLIQLSKNSRWYNRNNFALTEAKEILTEMNKTLEGRAILEAHAYEMSALKNDLNQWASNLKLTEEREKFRQIKDLLATVFEKVPYIHSLPSDKIKDETIEITEEQDGKEEVTEIISSQREQVLARSMELLGIPYKWAGYSLEGFDCSGFTAYLMEKELNKKIDRRASEQYQKAKKIKRKNVQPGDFIFFDHGTGIAHVGMIISVDKNSLQMIHSSTSLGISIIDVEKSLYWKERVAGYGTYF